MLAKFYSAAVYGVDAYEIEVEVNDGHGKVETVVVGLPDTAVKESRDRVSCIGKQWVFETERPPNNQSSSRRHKERRSEL